MTPENDPHTLRRWLMDLSRDFNCSIFELIQDSNYLPISDKQRLLKLAANQ